VQQGARGLRAAALPYGATSRGSQWGGDIRPGLGPEGEGELPGLDGAGEGLAAARRGGAG
jgi:hypothetical protein